ncbi:MULTISPECIES: MaoC family dehydratase [unclassified Rhizobium]|uniref:MaoC family dehydratase n=1 Tax=unclassified Rhizobium TaxID=2613769 RepID=UPI001ADBB667|nr:MULTISPECIES: MaoC family dehydratase [unclassified Rhizobium]MBO9127892.1 hypothetical protein [Rhizobium sp. 16-488-2b]MBO9178286.1 hypothetical protein [Rhizobium sp. 16-488-2a]
MTENAEKSKLWRDLTDPRRAVEIDDLEAGLKEPVFENLDIPEEFGPVSIIVDDHKIKRFSFTQDDYNPWYLQAGPFGDDRIGQACLLGNDLVQLFTLKYRGSKTVGFHTEEQMWFDNPVKLGEKVTMKGAYVESYVRRGQGYVIMEAQAVGEDGRSIIRHRGVEILRTVPGAIGGRASDTPSRPVTGEIPVNSRSIERVDATTKVGDVLSPLEKTVTAEQTAVFSRVGEYVKNTHSDIQVAREGQLRVPIVQGQQQAGLMGELMVRAFGKDWFTSGWFQLKFIAPLQVFDPIALTGKVTAVEKQADGRTKVELEVWVRRASDDRMTVVGWASCKINA